MKWPSFIVTLAERLVPPAALREKEPRISHYDHWSAHPSRGLTPESLAAQLLAAEGGDIREQIELYEDLVEKDLTVAAVRQVRRLAVALCENDVVPVDNSRAAKRQADFILDVIANLSAGELESNRADFLSFDDLLLDSLDSIGKGFSAPLLNWDLDGKEWRIVSARHINQKHFIFGNPMAEKWDPFDIRLRTEDEPISGVELAPYRHLVSYYRGQSAYPSRAGLLRGTAWYYLFKNFGFKSFVMYGELFGIPMRIGKFDPNAPADKAVLEEAVKNLGQDFAAVISKGSEIEIVDHMKSGGSDVHQHLITACNAEITKGWLGQTATTEATPGKLGNEDAKDQVRADLRSADAKALQSNIQNRFVAPLCRFNFGDVLCRFEIHYEDEEDLNTKAERYERVSKFLPIPLAHAYEEFGIPEPQEDEATTQAHLQAGTGIAPVSFSTALTGDEKKKS